MTEPIQDPDRTVEAIRGPGHTVDARFFAALHSGHTNLLRELHTYVRTFIRDTGQRADTVVVMAGTDLCASLSIVGGRYDREWSFNPETGLFAIYGSGIAFYVCEDTGLQGWQIRVRAAGFGGGTLGRPIVHEAMIAPTVPQ